MDISPIQAILIGIVYYLGTIGTPWLTLLGSISVLYKPLVGGTLVGLILGDPVQGCIYGAFINMPYVAFISAGGTAPQDPGLAGTLGTALAMAGGVSPEAAITIALPFGLLGTIIWVTHMTVDVFFVHMADEAAQKGDLDRICFLHVVPPQIFMGAICIIPVALGAYFGAGAMGGIITFLEGTPLHCMEVIGGLLPAIGIAMNLRAIGRPGTMLFFIAGFVLAVYLQLPIIAVAVLGGIIAFFYTMMTKGNGISGAMDDAAALEGGTQAAIADDDEEDF